MRVLLIANTLPPRDISGVGEQVVQLAAGLRERGLEVEVLGRGPGGAWGPKVLFPLSVVPPTLRRLWRFRPQVVQVHESDGALAALATVALRWVLRPRPLLLALQQVSYRRERDAVRALRDGGRVLGHPGKTERRFRRLKGPIQVVLGTWTSRLADRVLAPSAITADELRQDYGIHRVAVLPNVTGGLQIAAESCAAAAMEDTGFLLFVGRLRLRKGVEVLLQALHRLADSHPKARLLIAGDGEHRSALEQRCSELGLAERVRFLGRCRAGEVRDLLSRSAALVVPSIYEGMPLVILEAMEASRPVVASAVSGIPEVVREATGWLVPAEDSAALSLALRQVLEDPEEARRRGQEGRRRLDRLFRPARAARLWHDLVLEATTEREEGRS